MAIRTLVFNLYSFLLIGLLFIGKNFAYIPIGPVYISEFILSTIFFFTTISITDNLKARTIASLPIVVFLVLGTISLVRDIQTFPITLVLRDSVMWLYAVVALAVYQTLTLNTLIQLEKLFKKVFFFYLLWLPIAFYIAEVAQLPGFGRNHLVHLKAGEVGVILGMIGIYFVLYPVPKIKFRYFLWALWLADFILFTASNRSGMFSAIIPILGFLVVRFKFEYALKLIGVIFILILSLKLVSFFDFTIGGNKDITSISYEQFEENIKSTFLIEEEHYQGRALGTIKWRLNWWQNLFNEAVQNQYYFTGKGFGSDIASAYIYASHIEKGVRSPHNFFVGISIRGGWLMAISWLILVFGLVLTLLKRWFTTKDKLYLFLSFSLISFFFNSNFDVYLENPMGAIPFWFFIGISLWINRFYLPNATQ